MHCIQISSEKMEKPWWLPAYVYEDALPMSDLQALTTSMTASHVTGMIAMGNQRRMVISLNNETNHGPDELKPCFDRTSPVAGEELDKLKFSDLRGGGRG